MTDNQSEYKSTTLSYRNKIMTILRKNGRTPMPDAQLATKCRTNRYGAKNFRRAVDDLLHEGVIVARRRGYVLSDLMGYFPAVVVRLSRTFGFVRPEKSEEEIFVPGKFLLGAMVGDRVLAGRIPSRSGKPEGEVIAVLDPADTPLTGVITEDDGVLFFSPDIMPKTALQISHRDSVPHKAGEKVQAVVVFRGQRHRDHKVKITFIFGSAEKASVCAQAVVALYGARAAFPQEVLEEGQSCAEKPIPPEEYARRLDLRNVPIFTIDSASAKDLDDAISLEKTMQGYRLGVHIADVSHYVAPNTPLDKEALRRGTSIYYADRVIPMLPESLSNGICSLNPNEDRLTFSALLDLDEKGEILSYQFRKSIIHSAVKGVYSEVNQIIGGTASPELRQKYRAVLHMIPLLVQLRDVRAEERRLRGAPELETPEGVLTLNEEGVCVGVSPARRGKSESVVEEMMLLANEAAARMAREHHLPFVYRVHEKPNGEKIESLEKILLRLGLSVPKFTGDIEPRVLAEVLENGRGTEFYPILNVMVLRSMAKARYSDKPLGHFGLALEDYAHFTSPIRRYPDLAIHRILSSYLAAPAADALHARFDAFVQTAAQQSSDAEARAVSIEYGAEDCYKAEYMRARIGQEFLGLVSGIADFGFYVTLPNTVEGLVHVATLPEADWFNDEGIAFCEERGTESYRLGDHVRVQCTRADVNTGEIDFALV